MDRTFGAIEAGGTKIVCARGLGPDSLELYTFPTMDPGRTLEQVVEFFRSAPLPTRIGVGSFGPLDLDPASATAGWIMGTPKVGWSRFDLRGSLSRALVVPVVLETDVNAAAVGERLWGAARGLDDFVYLTVGTGIGGGAFQGGRLLMGRSHPEMGHMRIPVSPPFPGVCPFHGDCLEGLASGPALATRWGKRGEDLPDEHPAWEQEADYLALGLNNLVLTLSPRRLVIGGGVMRRRQLYPRIQERLAALLAGYVDLPELAAGDYVVPPGLGERAGILGALALAMELPQDQPARLSR